jgi:hygromycin-B 7''-O-kinase
MDSLNDLEHQDGYVRLFTAVPFWSPYVRAVCQRHGLLPAEQAAACKVRTGVAGTCPVFMVDERWVVKFFGRLFDGAAACAAEQAAGRLVGLDPAIRTARLVGSGALNEPGVDWPWPYLIYEYIPGVSFGEALEQISLADRLQTARELGDTVRRLHALPLAGSPVFRPSYQPYLAFLREQRAQVTQRQREWDRLPAHLLAQIEDFLPPLEALVDFSHPPHLIHADLTRDHLLGRFEFDPTGSSSWRSLAVIDFGDARTGDLLYELSALHLDLFSGDLRLLAAFLEAYGLSPAERADLPRKALSTALLHQFNVFASLPEALRTEIRQVPSLADLAERLWQTGSADPD